MQNKYMNKVIIFIFSLASSLLFCVVSLHAQQQQETDRHITLEGANFTVGTLIEGIESQTDIILVNRSPVIDLDEVIGEVVSPEMVRDVVDQVLSGTDYILREATAFAVVTVERTDAGGNHLLDRIFVNTSTGQIVAINDVFGAEALGARGGAFDEMVVTQVLSGRTYIYHSAGIYTIVTAMIDENGRQVERQIAIDMATQEIVPIERLVTPVPLPPLPVADEDAAFTFPDIEYLPRWAIKTNLLYGAATTMNLGAEFLLNRYLTLDISAGWNPFVHRNNRKFAHWMLQPTLRYWIQEPFNGHFFGVSLMFADFNVSDIRQPYNLLGVFPELRNHRFRGQAYSASLQYGHQWVLSPRWSIEVAINAGYMFLDYERFEGGWCGQSFGNHQRHYFGITNAAVSLIYIIR
jgi:hypothetical protein